MTQTSRTDWIAILGGGVAVLAALLTLTLYKRTSPYKRGERIGLTVALLALGVYQVIGRGF